jgi:hypothetical protein
MTETNCAQAFITACNIVILISLPAWFWWHCTLVRHHIKWTFDWWLQVLTVIGYILAIGCEIPALWARLIIYYQMNMLLPPGLYYLTSWDRWGHVIFYGWFILFTFAVAKGRIPKTIVEAFG